MATVDPALSPSLTDWHWKIQQPSMVGIMEKMMLSQMTIYLTRMMAGVSSQTFTRQSSCGAIFCYLEPFEAPQEPIKAEPITSIIPANNNASSISSFGSANANKPMRGAMKLGQSQPPSLAEVLDDSSYTPPSSRPSVPHAAASNGNQTDRKAELERKREERRQVKGLVQERQGRSLTPLLSPLPLLANGRTTGKEEKRHRG